MSEGHHSPNSLRDYFSIHDTVMARYLGRQDPFVVAESLQNAPISGAIRICGEIACRGNILITVDKYLEILSADDGPDTLVRTFLYQYNASIQGKHNILRYDNVHAHGGHGDSHHKHIYDWRSGDEVQGSPFWVGVHGWPTLGKFIAEVEDWYWDNRLDLPDPDAVPSLGKSRFPVP